ncbi:hypothetical protein SLE2022_067190 [Rubroshorea leprosula]
MALWGLLISPTSAGKQYLVGDTAWSIPSSPTYYSNWSSSILLFVGDSLLFKFESEFHNVMQVTRLDYESCTTKNPINALISGPAIVSLMEPGVFYFICNVSNYCDLGQKVCITVHKQSASTTLSPAPSPVPSGNSSAPSTLFSPPFRPLEPPYATIGSPSMPSNHNNSSEAPARVAVGSTGMLFMWDSMFHFWIFLLVGMIM